MLKNYLLLAYRNLIAHKVTSMINVVGLSIAVACAIAVFLILKNFWTLDDFHANGEQIFMVEYTTETDGEIQTFGDAPAPIATALAADFPQVKRAVRIQRLAMSFGYIAGLALLIACLGLYGLAAQHFSRRVKEVSVRKVLGVSVAHIILLVNRQFLLSLAAAGFIANLIAFAGIGLVLQQTQEFTGSFQPGLLPFLTANAVVFLTAAVAVGIQSWKVATVQVPEALRQE